MRKTLTCLVVATMAGCPDVEVDPGEGSDFVLAPTVEFDPASGIIPFPNDLLRDPTTGRINIPAAPCETPAQTALRENTLNQLNGFGTFEVPIQVTFTQPVDPNSIANHILLFQTTPPTLIPTTPFVGTTLRFSAANCNAPPAVINTVTVVPQIPLQENTTYIVVVTQGVTNASGQAFVPSPTWALLSQPTPAVVFDEQGNLIVNRTPLLLGQDANGNGVPDTDELLGLARLEQGFQPLFMFLGALGISPSDTLVAFAFTTQTTTDPLVPEVAGSVASMLPTTPLVGARSVTGGATGQAFLQQATAGQCGRLPSCCQVDGGPLPCQAVGDVVGAVLVSPDYQQPLPNPLGGSPIPGPWSDPYHPTKVADAQLQVIVVIPATPPPASGYPTVIFAHGLTSSKESVFAIAPQLAAVGIMTVAMDIEVHGSRAVQVSNDAAIGCSGTPAPTAQPQCFAPFLSTDLATTRDNVRQSALDFERLAIAVAACGTTACSEVTADPNRLMFLGQSLGGIVGTLVVASSPLFKSAVFSVTGVGLLDLLEHTETLEITFPFVDALIDAGALQGEKSNLAANPPTGLCTTDAWKTQPGYQQFAAVARWVLDPADGANYTRLLAMKRVLLEEVIGDLVVPNFATNTLGVLLGLSPMMADPATSIPPPPSRAITPNPNASKWVQSVDLRPAPPFPGNTFAHASLLRPANDQADGLLGTARMQSDAITYLRNNE